MCFFHVFIWYQRPMMTAGGWHDIANEDRPITRPHAQRFDRFAVLMTNSFHFVYGICYRENTQQTSDIHEPSNKLRTIWLLSRRLTNREAECIEFPSICMNHHKANGSVFKSRTTIWLVWSMALYVVWYNNLFSL